MNASAAFFVLRARREAKDDLRPKCLMSDVSGYGATGEV